MRKNRIPKLRESGLFSQSQRDTREMIDNVCVTYAFE